MAKKPVEIRSQLWWKFSRYELRDGYIRPARAAKLLRYQPWDAHWQARRHPGRKQQSPYFSLTTLVSDLGASPTVDGRLTLNPFAEKKVLDWCDQFGLLGVLLQQTQHVVFPPRVVENTLDDDAPPPWPATAVLEHYVREVPTWKGVSSYSRPGGAVWDSSAITNFWEPVPEGLPSESLPDCGPLTSDHPLPAEWPPPHVLSRHITGQVWQHVSLEEGWFKFFPDLRDHTKPTPAPLSDTFWKAYAEPLDLFLGGAALLKQAMEASQIRRSVKGEDREDRLKQSIRAFPGEDALRGLVNAVAPSFVRERQRPNRREGILLAPSLLGMFAAMLLDDLTIGKNIRRCAACPNLFASGAHAANYCSERCRWRSMKQRYRKAESAKDRARSKTSRRGSQSRARR